MQLIHESQPTRDTKTNMSTQAENPISCKIADMKLEISANKENNPKFDDGTISFTANNLNVEAETTKQTIIAEDSNINGNEHIDSNLDETDTEIKEDELLNSIDSLVMGKLANGTSDSCNKNQSECKNIFSDIVTVNHELGKNMELFSSDRFADATENDALLNEQIELSKNELEKTTYDNYKKVVVSTEISETSNVKKKLNVQETDSSSKRNKVIEDGSTENLEDDLISEENYVTSGDKEKELIKVSSANMSIEDSEPMIEDTHGDATVVEDPASLAGFEKVVTVSTENVNTEVNMLKTSENVALSNEETNTTEATVKKNTTNDDNHLRRISIEGELSCSSENLGPLATITNKSDHLSDETGVENTALNTVDISIPEDVEMEKQIIKSDKDPLLSTSDNSTRINDNNEINVILNTVDIPLSGDVAMKQAIVIPAQQSLTIPSHCFSDTVMNNELKIAVNTMGVSPSHDVAMQEEQVKEKSKKPLLIALDCSTDIVTKNESKTTLNKVCDLLAEDVAMEKEIVELAEPPFKILDRSPETLTNRSNTSMDVVDIMLPEDVAMNEKIFKLADTQLPTATDSYAVTETNNSSNNSLTIVDVLHPKTVAMDKEVIKSAEETLQMASETSAGVVKPAEEPLANTSDASTGVVINNESNTTLNAVDDLIPEDVAMEENIVKPAEEPLANTSDASTGVVINNESNTMLNAVDVLIPEDVAMEAEIVKPAEEPLAIASDTSSSVVINTESNIMLNTVDVLIPEDVAMEEDVVKPAEETLAMASDTSTGVVINNESNTMRKAVDVLIPEDNGRHMEEEVIFKPAAEPSSIISDTTHVIIKPFVDNTLGDAIVDGVGKTFTADVNGKNILTLTGIGELSTVDEEKLSSVQETLDGDECNSDKKETTFEFNKTDCKSSANETSNKITDSIDDKCTELSVNVVQGIGESVSDIENADEKKLVNIEIENEDVPMEVDDVEVIDLDTEKHDLNISSSKSSLNNILDDETNLKNTVELEQILDIIEEKSSKEHLCNEDVEKKTDKSLENDNVPLENKAKEFDDEDKVEIIDEDEISIVEKLSDETTGKSRDKVTSPVPNTTLPVVCKLSNTLNILSDDEEEEPSNVETNEKEIKQAEKQCIDIEDDDDIMLIEDDNSKEATNEDSTEDLHNKDDSQPKPNNKEDLEIDMNELTTMDITELAPKIHEKDSSPAKILDTLLDPVPQTEKINEEKTGQNKPLLPQNFLKAAKKNLAEMTRDELEEFCILRIVEGIVDRSNLSDIKTQIKTMAQNLEEFRKRASMLTKQNRDLQVVLKSVQEEQKKRTTGPIQPLKITRSVGMQVLMNDKLDTRRKGLNQSPSAANAVGRPPRVVPIVKTVKPPVSPATIPVPRKVPVNNSPAKALANTPPNNSVKQVNPNINGMRNPSPVQKAPEKRTHSRMQSTSSVCVDLTDDEPPAKITNVPPVRVVPPQNLMSQQRPFAQPLNSPRKVYIPISGPQGQSIRPGQTLMLKGGPLPGLRQRLPPMPRMQQSPIRVPKQLTQRHPAPLPDAMKQYTPPTWKALPPAPDLKLSKVENGIVISWKIDGYPDGGYETIASYQLYAYQETTSPPCTALWKKIGDVKALPLPMACTLTQFMAGFKYYFAVRAVDIRSRLGPFSLPGSILLLNKM